MLSSLCCTGSWINLSSARFLILLLFLFSSGRLHNFELIALKLKTLSGGICQINWGALLASQVTTWNLIFDIINIIVFWIYIL